MFVKQFRWLTFPLILSIFSTLAATAHPSVDVSPSDNLAQIEAQKIVVAKEQLRGLVLDIKEKYKPSDKEYVEARGLYRKTQSEVAGWVAVLVLAIKKGNTKDLRKDEKYLTTARDAGEASKAFVEYAEEVTVQTKGIFPFADAVVGIGLKIWNEVRERRNKERERYAEAFQREVKWERWEEIKPDLPKL